MSKNYIRKDIIDLLVRDQHDQVRTSCLEADTPLCHRWLAMLRSLTDLDQVQVRYLMGQGRKHVQHVVTVHIPHAKRSLPESLRKGSYRGPQTVA